MILSTLITNPLFGAAPTGTPGQFCGGKVASAFLKFPTWYEYIAHYDSNGVCTPTLTSITDIWLIVAAVIEILLHIAALLAVGFVIYGGIQYTTSSGSSDRTNAAKNTLISAVVGLVICIVAAVIVAFIAGSFN